MSNPVFKLSLIGSVLVAGLLLSLAESGAEITSDGKPDPTRNPATRSYESVGPDAPLRVQCWQQGREIIDQGNLFGMALKPLLEQASVSFKTKQGGSPEIHIIAIDETTCLIRGAG